MQKTNNANDWEIGTGNIENALDGVQRTMNI
jgi:hypothetical protein